MKDDYKAVFEKWGATHSIEKRMGTNVWIKLLHPWQSVVYGDGKTYHWLLTRKEIEIKCKCGARYEEDCTCPNIMNV